MSGWHYCISKHWTFRASFFGLQLAEIEYNSSCSSYLTKPRSTGLYTRLTSMSIQWPHRIRKCVVTMEVPKYQQQKHTHTQKKFYQSQGGGGPKESQSVFVHLSVSAFVMTTMKTAISLVKCFCSRNVFTTTQFLVSMEMDCTGRNYKG